MAKYHVRIIGDGNVVNNGRGRGVDCVLIVGDGNVVSDELEEIIELGPEVFQGCFSLVLTNIPGSVDIQPHDNPNVVVEMRGSARVVGDIVIGSRFGTLTIDGSAVPTAESITVRPTVGGSVLTVTSGRVDRLAISVKVPRVTELIISDVKDTTVGDVGGALCAILHNTGSKLMAQSSKSSTLLSAYTGAKIVVEKVDDGHLELEAYTGGTIRLGDVAAARAQVVASTGGGIVLTGGRIGDLSADASTAGSFTFGGTVFDLDAEASTGGLITVARVNGHPRVRTNTGGEVVIGED